MAIPTSHRPVMTLYTGQNCIFSHSCRFVLVEKDVDCHIVETNTEEAAGELSEINPYNETPALVDRDLVLYGAAVINEYLEERLPHPPLMPVDPVSRARARLMIMRFEREWVKPYYCAQRKGQDLSEDAAKDIRDGLISLSPMLSRQSYLLGDEFGLVDCVVAPLLWRMRTIKVKLPSQARPVSEYAKRLFSRKAFEASLTDTEREMASK